MDELTKTLPKLKVLYAMSTLQIDPWLSDLRALADDSMNKGVYCELFRMILYDQKTEHEDAQFSLASTITKLDPSNALPDFQKCCLLIIKSLMEDILINKHNAIDIAQDIVFGSYAFYDLFHRYDFDHGFLKLHTFSSIYLNWESPDSHIFKGKELEARRVEVLSELQTAAREWLAKQSPGL